jgi:pimeloyl-ACP methyl ester carboxylesterase
LPRRSVPADDDDVTASELVTIGAGDLEVEVSGSGEPVVVVQTALTADELRPLAQRVAAAGGFRVVHYHRRGYAGSGPSPGPGSMRREAEDCRTLMEVLGIAPAHVVGASFSAAIGLALAAADPAAVRSLALIEPPPVGVPSAGEFRAASRRLLATHAARGPVTALTELMTMLAGPGWRELSERDLPGSVAAMERDAETFFTADVPALLSWRFGDDDAARVRCPVLHVGGTESGPWFAEMRQRLLRVLPRAECGTVPGAGHLLATSHPDDTARLVVDHLRRHAAIP